MNEQVKLFLYVIFLMFYSLVFWLIFLVVLILIAFASVIFMPVFMNRRASYRFFTRFFSRAFLCLMFQSPKVRGGENIPKTGGLILVSNHWSVLDFFLLNAVSPRFLNMFVESFFFISPLNGLPDGAGLLEENDKTPAVAALSIRKAISAVMKGEAVVFFPAGIIFDKVAAISPMKPGVYRVLEETDPAVIPVNIRQGIPMGFTVIPRRPEIIFGRPLRKRDVLSGRDEILKSSINSLS